MKKLMLLLLASPLLTSGCITNHVVTKHAMLHEESTIVEGEHPDGCPWLPKVEDRICPGAARVLRVGPVHGCRRCRDITGSATDRRIRPHHQARSMMACASTTVRSALHPLQQPPNPPVEPTGTSRSCQGAFAAQERLVPAAHQHPYPHAARRERSANQVLTRPRRARAGPGSGTEA
jgi:hypothetical protein